MNVLLTIALLGIPTVLLAMSDTKKASKPSNGPPPFPLNIPPNGEGGIVLASFQQETGKLSEDLTERNRQLLRIIEEKEAHQAFTLNDVAWTEVFSSYGDMAARIPVMTDALKMGGVRINVDFLTAQRIADVLGVVLLTPKVSDLIHQQSGVKILPSNMPWLDPKHFDARGKNVQGMIEHSQAVDKKIATINDLPKKWERGWNDLLVNNPGKYWVTTKRNWEEKNMGANYGWYTPYESDGMIQGPRPGLKHNINHVDYSQVFRAMGPTITIETIDGTEVLPTVDVLKSPALAPLISNEGALLLARHPDIPPYTSSVTA